MIPVVFITDALLFLLVLMVILFMVYAKRREHIIEPWRHVAKRPMAMSSAVILVVYVCFALLDSLHFHPKLESAEGTKTEYSTEIISVLDILTAHMKENVEKTYSAPFATHAYAKETVEMSPGKQMRDYPRLFHAGTHLHDPNSSSIDIAARTLVGLFIGILILISMLCILSLIMKKNINYFFLFYFKRKNSSSYPIGAILITFSMVVLFLSTSFYLSHFYHILGTDKVGQDVFYHSLKSIRTGLLIGTLTTLVMLPFALLLGIMAGYFRGWIDDAIQYVYTTLNSIPGVLLIAASILMLDVYMSNHANEFTSTAHRSDLRLLFLCIILGIMSWTGLCRMLRGEVMKLREVEYVQAAQAFGVDSLTIMLRHLLPNIMHIVMISIVLDFSGLVLAEAVLAYINIGVDPSMISWGNMINSARLEMAREPMVWWSLLAAFFFMLCLVLAANLFADAVRDAYDPRIREARF